MDRIRSWIYRNARPIDLKRFQYHFEGGSKESVLECLSYYQNEDGGFSDALEADSWNPNSSPIQTWTAIEILKELDVSEHNMIYGILSYMESGKDFENMRWLNTIASNNEYPGAPWWHHEENAAYNLRFNPSASLAGFALLYASKESRLYKTALEIAKDAISYVLKHDLDEMHELYCFLDLRDYILKATISLSNFELFEEKIKKTANDLIEKDFSKWQAYVCKPSQFTNKPNDYLDPKVCLHELEFIRQSRTTEGIWDIPWQWGDYKEEFAISKNWWKANVIIKNLLLLKHYNENL